MKQYIRKLTSGESVWVATILLFCGSSLILFTYKVIFVHHGAKSCIYLTKEQDNKKGGKHIKAIRIFLLLGYQRLDIYTWNSIHPVEVSNLIIILKAIKVWNLICILTK